MAKPRKKKRAHALSDSWDDARKRATNAILGPRNKPPGYKRLEATQRSANKNFGLDYHDSYGLKRASKATQRARAEDKLYGTGDNRAWNLRLQRRESDKWFKSRRPKTGAGKSGRAKTFSSFDSALKADRKKRGR